MNESRSQKKVKVETLTSVGVVYFENIDYVTTYYGVLSLYRADPKSTFRDQLVIAYALGAWSTVAEVAS